MILRTGSFSLLRSRSSHRRSSPNSKPSSMKSMILTAPTKRKRLRRNLRMALRVKCPTPRNKEMTIRMTSLAPLQPSICQPKDPLSSAAPSQCNSSSKPKSKSPARSTSPAQWNSTWSKTSEAPHCTAESNRSSPVARPFLFLAITILFPLFRRA
jgi:hypothetical protein